MIRIGELDRYVGLCHRVLTKNALGEQVPSWPTAYANVWAKRIDAMPTRSGSRLVIADQGALIIHTQFQIYYRDDLLATDHIVDEYGLAYEIVQMGEIGRRDFSDLLCKAVKP